MICPSTSVSDSVPNILHFLHSTSSGLVPSNTSSAVSSQGPSPAGPPVPLFLETCAVLLGPFKRPTDMGQSGLGGGGRRARPPHPPHRAGGRERTRPAARGAGLGGRGGPGPGVVGAAQQDSALIPLHVTLTTSSHIGHNWGDSSATFQWYRGPLWLRARTRSVFLSSSLWVHPGSPFFPPRQEAISTVFKFLRESEYATPKYSTLT